MRKKRKLRGKKNKENGERERRKIITTKEEKRNKSKRENSNECAVRRENASQNVRVRQVTTNQLPVL